MILLTSLIAANVFANLLYFDVVFICNQSIPLLVLASEAGSHPEFSDPQYESSDPQ
jgi:hypothetical protein